MRLFPGPVIRLSVRHIRKRVYIPQPSDAYLNDRLVYDESEIDAASVSKEASRTLNDLALKPKLHVEDENFDVSLNSAPKQKLYEDKKSPKLFHFPSPEPLDRVGTDSADEGKRFVIRDESDGRAIKKLKKPLRVAKALNFSRIPLEKQAIFLFPGQGSQFVGMGRQLLDCDASRNLFEAAKHILGYDLLKLCLDGPKESLDRTVHCQPAVFVASLAAVEKLRQERPEAVENAVAAAGFSVGEYAALVFAKTLSFAEGLRIVQIRAEAMQKCSEAIPSGMVTVRVSADSQLGEALIHARRATMQAHHSQEPTVCSVANYLLQGMQVVGGDDVTLSFLDQNAREYNIEVVKRLPVSGAFHTKRMRDAAAPVEEALNSAEMSLPVIDVYSNVTGAPYERNIGRIKRNLVDQIYLPVKWEQIQQLLFRRRVGDHFPRYFELGPGRQLGAMFYYVSKKAHKSLTNVPV